MRWAVYFDLPLTASPRSGMAVRLCSTGNGPKKPLRMSGILSSLPALFIVASCGITGCCGCISGDNITHHASARFQTYLSKLKFRVINNLFHPEESGYSARTAQKAPTMLSRRKNWFILYSATLVGPLFDSFYLAIKHKDASFLFAFYLCLLCLYSNPHRHCAKTLWQNAVEWLLWKVTKYFSKKQGGGVKWAILALSSCPVTVMKTAGHPIGLLCKNFGMIAPMNNICVQKPNTANGLAQPSIVNLKHGPNALWMLADRYPLTI